MSLSADPGLPVSGTLATAENARDRTAIAIADLGSHAHTDSMVGWQRLVLCASLAGCSTRPSRAAEEKAAITLSGIDSQIIDRRTNPCDDLYRFACGGWLDATTIPPDRPAWSRSFSEINERNLAILRAILDRYARGTDLDQPYARKLGDLYATCMDEAKAESASPRTLAEWMGRIDSLRGPRQLPALIAHLHLAGVGALFSFESQQDFKDAQEVIGVADQGGLGLPDRDYYLKADAKSVEIREAYRAHVARMLALSGVPEPTARRRADVVLSIETALASASMPRDERRDPARVYHRLNRTGLARAAPAFDWSAYFEALGHPDITAINVAVPQFFEGMNRLLVETTLPDVKAYLGWHLLQSAAPAMGQALVFESFRFRSKNLSGESELLPRWKRCLAAVDEGMGDALGRPFVAETFGAGGKEDAEELVRSVEDAFRRNLTGLAWMDAPTRAEAMKKLDLVQNKIGYPEKGRNYAGLVVTRESDLANRMRAAAFETERDLSKIGKPVDRAEWHVPPQTVNAYYDPSLNEMVFPAGILQPPFFDKRASSALDFGGIGVVMGHELTHGFDDEGRKFDGQGDLRQWWTIPVERAFEDRVRCVVAQYGTYQVAGGVHIDGRLTAGENIADMGGLRVAYEAYRAGPGDPLTDVGGDGLTSAQRFFVAYAQSWCTKRRPEYARMLAAIDPHSPPEDRVNGAASNLPEFGDAFACRAGAPMSPSQRCRVW